MSSKAEPRIVCDFILLLADGWGGRLLEIVQALHGVGAKITYVDIPNCVIEGVVEQARLPDVERLPFARRVSEGAAYVADPPATPRITRTTPPPAPVARHTRRPLPRPGQPAPARRVQSHRSRAVRSPIARQSSPLRQPQSPPGMLMSITYAVVAGLAAWLILQGITLPTLPQVLNRTLCAGAILALSTASAVGFRRVPALRHLCVFAGFWLMVSSALLPGPLSPAGLFGGLATFLIAGLADDAITCPRAPLAREIRVVFLADLPTRDAH